MTLSQYLAEKGMDLNMPVQTLSQTPGLPDNVATLVSISGGTVQYACGPTTLFLISTVGYDPDVPTT